MNSQLENRIGHYILSSTTGESFKAYVPKELPPIPPLEFTSSLTKLLEEANRAIGKLDGMSLLAPNIALIIYMFIRKEALLSSQIEGIPSSFSDLMLYENDDRYCRDF